MDAFTHPWLKGILGDEASETAWSADRQLEHYIAFEAALARALEATGRLDVGTGEAAATAIEAFQPDIARLSKGTARDGLPIPQLVADLRAHVTTSIDAVHAGATSQDVLDTALALTLRDLNDDFEVRIEKLCEGLLLLEDQFGTEKLMGRTRMQAALPITVRDRLRTWRGPLADHRDRLAELRPRIEVVQLGGAVGTRAQWGDNAEGLAQHMASTLGIGLPTRVWHTDRTGLAEYASWLSLTTGTLGKIGQDITLMAQQGIGEITIRDGGGSSAMPHKSNPIKAELLITLARFNAVQVSAMHAALVHEQERSGAAWMLEWLVLPAMTAATGRAISAASELCASIVKIGSP